MITQTYFSLRTQSAYSVTRDGEELLIFSGFSHNPEQNTRKEILSLTSMEIVGEKGTKGEMTIKAPGVDHEIYRPYSSRHASAVTLSSGMLILLLCHLNVIPLIQVISL